MFRSDRAYAAGLIDGEGCIMLRNRVRTTKAGYAAFNLVVRVGTIDSILCPWLAKHFGGKLGTETKKNGLVVHTWTLYGHNAILFLRQVEPFLKLKHEQACLAIEYEKQAMVGSGNPLSVTKRAIQAAYYLRLQELKQEV